MFNKSLKTTDLYSLINVIDETGARCQEQNVQVTRMTVYANEK